MNDGGSATRGVLATLAAGQFVMALDSTVMNVSIVTVAEDVGTDITGIQTAITLYTLVMASLMVTGGKVGQILGHKRAFVIGAVIYAAGSLTTALAPNLLVLLIGWSLLEGIGAALILPAIVALVASNFSLDERPRAYGLMAAGAAVAIAVGPLIGGLSTTYLSWRWVFVGEAVVIGGILVFSRRMSASPADPTVRLDLVGTVLSALGLGGFVFGILRSGVWGFVSPAPDAPELLGISLAFWSMLAGCAILWGFVRWEQRVLDRGGAPLVDPSMLTNIRLRTSLLAFGFQFLLQGGLFYLISLYLSVALGLSAIGTGVRLMPLSITLLGAAVLIPKLLPTASPRRIARFGFGALVGGTSLLLVLLQFGDGPAVVTGPLLLAGLGAGALASQLANVAVSSVPQERSGEVGGLQNTATNLGASIATALAGAVLVSALTSSFMIGLAGNPDVPAEVIAAAETELVAGVPFLSDAQLVAALEQTELSPAVVDEILEVNTDARIEALRRTLGVLVLIGVGALFVGRRLPDRQPSLSPQTEPIAG